MIQVKALTNRNYSPDGIKIQALVPGETIELKEGVAKSLLAQKAVELASQKASQRPEVNTVKEFGDDLFPKKKGRRK